MRSPSWHFRHVRATRRQGRKGGGGRNVAKRGGSRHDPARPSWADRLNGPASIPGKTMAPLLQF